MNYLLAVLIIAGSIAAACWLRRQQHRIEFDAHVAAALDLVTGDNEQDFRAWEIQCRPTYWGRA